MEPIDFIKMHGLGNDFVIIDGRNQVVENPSELAKYVNQRQFGVGCDQMILILPPQAGGDVVMRIFNADGSEPESCGNASRCVADLLFKEIGKDQVTLETLGGPRHCWRAEDGMVKVDMGEPKLRWHEIPLARDVGTLRMPVPADDGTFPERLPVGVNMGNPHCVFFVDRIGSVDLAFIGSQTETYELFPERTNVQIAQVLDRNTVQMRVWERGVGITMASGSSACATAVAAIRRGYTDREVLIKMDGGELQIEWRESDNHVYMTGPVAYVFKGMLL
ncbi:MAG: diaminopimelate epimerase [Pseudobdellovibrionaceae bacterium]